MYDTMKVKIDMIIHNDFAPKKISISKYNIIILNIETTNHSVWIIFKHYLEAISTKLYATLKYLTWDETIFNSSASLVRRNEFTRHATIAGRYIGIQNSRNPLPRESTHHLSFLFPPCLRQSRARSTLLLRDDTTIRSNIEQFFSSTAWNRYSTWWDKRVGR